MFNDSVSFNGGTRVEVIAVLANCGRDTDRARRALVTWIRHKQAKNRSTEHILVKLRDIESKFIQDLSLHDAFRDARAQTFLPRPPDLPPVDSDRKRSSSQRVFSSPYSPSAPDRRRPTSVSSSVVEISPDVVVQKSPQSFRSSGNSSQMSELSLGRSKSGATRPISQPQGVPHIPQARSPPIEIPRILRPGLSSPITSSPEDAASMHARPHHLSHPVVLFSQSLSVATPQSADSPETSAPFRRKYSDPHGYAYHARIPPEPVPQAKISALRSRPRRDAQSPGTSSSEESDIRQRQLHMARTVGRMSPGRSRVAPPKTCPPDLPLPPIPSDDQGVESDDNASNKSTPMDVPPTPVRFCTVQGSTPVRPLPIQPIPSPIAGGEEWEQLSTIDDNSLRQCWQGSNGSLPLLREMARQDSPVYEFHEDCGGQSGVPPPPYAKGHDTPPETPTIGDALDRAVSVCGDSHDVRREVSKCIKFYRGYEPPYWQTRLQACGLNAEAAKYLVDEMSKQVDWAASFNRAA